MSAVEPITRRASLPSRLATRGMAEFASLAGRSDCAVLLCGETGCGKTHLARLVHESSPRAAMPFVRINCGSIPDTLFEREMFGHVRGAFTDARESGAGFVEAAHRGTLFLDEIGELPLAMQSKLLAVLEDGTFRRLGSTRESTVDVRFIAATNRDLDAMVQSGAFRRDLFYRISVIQYRVPALHERRKELPLLISELLRRHAPPVVEIDPDAMQLLCAYRWPGNIRELENALRAAMVYSGGRVIEPEHLPPHVRDHGPSHTERYCGPAEPERESQTIREAVAAANGNKAAAARTLGMSRSTLWAKLNRYGA